MYFPLNPECIYLDWISQGVLPDQTEVAVKTLSQKSCQGKQEFLNEAALITAVQHRNLVKLKGCCLERDHRILVYEFMENKSLHQTLFGEFHLSKQILRSYSKASLLRKTRFMCTWNCTKVCDVIVGTSNSTDSSGHWISLGIVSSSCQSHITKIAFSSFRNTVEMQKTEV